MEKIRKSKTKIISFLSILCTILFYQSSASADQYLITSPVPEPYKQFDVAVYEASYTTNNYTSVYIPQIDLFYGVLPNLEADLYLNYAYIHPYAPNSSIANGIGDTSVEIVYRFLTESKYLPSIAFEPLYTFPTGDANQGLGNGKPLALLPFYLQKTFGSWQVFGGVGYIYNTAPSTDNYFFGGARVNENFTDRFSMAVEIYEQGATGSTSSPSPIEGNAFVASNLLNVARYTLINVGASYQIMKSLALQASAGKSISGANVLISYAGFDWSI